MSEPLHRVGDAERDHSGWDLFLLWAGAGIALPEIWAGGLIVKLGLVAGACATLLGHLIGNTVLAGAALMGARHGISAIVSTRAALGYRGSHLAALLNVAQMIGWTAFMVWVGGLAAAELPLFTTLGPKGWMLAIGLVTTAWAMMGHRTWRLAQRATVLMLIGLSVLLTWRVLQAYPLATLRALPRDPGFPFWQGLDLVVVMPISWLPLVADYTRYARNPARGTAGTWIGYFVGSVWMYLIGLGAALATGSDTPDAMVVKLLADTGWIVPAMALVVISTLTTTFLNVFSNAVSVQSLWPRASERALVVAGGLLGTGLAFATDASQFVPFLTYIGAAFCPLFGIVLSDYFLLRGGQLDAEALFRPDGYRYWRGVNPVALLVWALGFIYYEAASRLAWPGGAALPALAASGLIYLVLMKVTARSKCTS